MDNSFTSSGSLSSYFQVDSGAVSISGAVANDSLDAVDITLGSDLTTGSHAVTVNPFSSNDLRNYVGYSVLKTGLNFTNTAPTTSATATVEQATPTKIILKFDRDVENLNAANIYATYSSITPSSVYLKGTTTNGANFGSEWEINFAQPLTGNINLVIVVLE